MLKDYTNLRMTSDEAIVVAIIPAPQLTNGKKSQNKIS